MPRLKGQSAGTPIVEGRGRETEDGRQKDLKGARVGQAASIGPEGSKDERRDGAGESDGDVR